MQLYILILCTGCW